MTGGEMAYLALVLTGVISFTIVVFTLSSGFSDPTKRAPRANELPRGGAKAAI